MIYDVRTRELRTDRGRLLKTLHCPLHKEWSQLTVVESVTPQRHCASCDKFVLDLSRWSDDEAELLLGQDPEHCVYAAPGTPNLHIVGERDFPGYDPCPYRRIQTARGEDAINQGARDGFWPLVQKVEPSEKIQSWMAVYQNVHTGEIRTVDDYRYSLKSPWKQIVKPFTFYPIRFEHHIAAYLIPKELKIGERVFLTDLIEDRISVFMNQGAKYRLNAAYAFWNGSYFEVDWDEDKDAQHWCLLG